MLNIKNLNITFDKPIFKAGDFYASNGEIVSIDGESGSGKTTLLKYILNNVKPEFGEMYFQDQLIDEESWDEFLFSHVSYVSQMGEFYPNMTIKQHFDFYSQLYKLELDEDIIKESLKTVNLDNVDITKSPIKLSTGERKRFLIALALYIKKDIILLDEPTASIDYQSKEILLNLLKRISREGVTVIIATHDQSVLDISDNVFTIQDCKLICSKDNMNKEAVFLGDNKKTNKIKYRKYKGLKLKILFIILILVGSLCVSFISQTVSLTIALNASQSNQTKNYKNNKLYLVKTVDPSNPLSYVNAPDNAPNGPNIDFINKDELDSITKIDGVKEILPVVMTDESRQDIEIEILKNNELLKKVETKIDVGVDTLMSATVVITGYYPEEEIIKDGQKITGIYINDTMEEILGLNNYKNIQIKYTQRFPTCLSKDAKNFILSPLTEPKEVIIPIDGVLSMSDYYDGRLKNYGRIYMPVQQLKNMMEKYYKLEDDENGKYEVVDYQYRAYMIICDDEKDEQVKLAIEKKNPAYRVLSDYLSNKEYMNYMRKQINSSFLLMSLSSIALLSGTIALIFYYMNTRKNEMKLLKNDGLKKNIKKYYREDSYIIMFSSFAVSLISLCLYYLFVLPIYNNQVSKELFIIVWICTTIVILSIIYFIKEKFTKRYI